MAYLEISPNELEISPNELEISSNHFEISAIRSDTVTSSTVRGTRMAMRCRPYHASVRATREGKTS